MFNYNSVGDSRYRSPLVIADFRKQGSGRNKKNTLPGSSGNLRQNIGRKHRCRTAAAASAGMGVLCFIVIDQKTAVLMETPKINTPFKKEIQKDFLSYFSKISGKNSIVIFRDPAKVKEILPDRIAGSRSHTCLLYTSTSLFFGLFTG